MGAKLFPSTRESICAVREVSGVGKWLSGGDKDASLSLTARLADLQACSLLGLDP